jgi:hypothetical protein
VRVLRGMRPARDGLPRVGNSGSKLGARPDYAENDIHPEDRIRSGDSIRLDIRVSADGLVQPNTGGISVALPPASNLPPHRRPPKHEGDDPSYEVYELETNDLPDELRARVDPRGPTRHVFIEPAWEMSFEEYQQALHATRSLWRLVQ